jgi:EAL domain-containing protein (putative c-di-GMP-specific phosphodiesterase class I)
VSGSVGIASFPEDGGDLDTLVRHADKAMYQAKERGRNNFQFYSAELNRLSHHRYEQERRMRGALDRGEFFVEYQPEVDFASGRIVTAEALLRWRDPEAGIVMPAQFLPLAEESGSATAIGLWVIDKVLGDARSLRDKGHELQVSVNVSARQLQQQDLAAQVAATLERHGLPPRTLRIEVNEPALMEDSEATHRTLRELRQLGVELGIDDFGAGYSSLGLLRGLPLQVVKLDRTLVSSCPSKRECVAIVQGAMAMAHALGLRVVAEGVENGDQMRELLRMGCDAGQGYYFFRPLDYAGLTAAMTRAVAEHTFTA